MLAPSRDEDYPRTERQLRSRGEVRRGFSESGSIHSPRRGRSRPGPLPMPREIAHAAHADRCASRGRSAKKRTVRLKGRTTSARKGIDKKETTSNLSIRSDFARTTSRPETKPNAFQRGMAQFHAPEAGAPGDDSATRYSRRNPPRWLVASEHQHRRERRVSRFTVPSLELRTTQPAAR